MSPEDDNEDVSRDLPEIEKRRKPREVVRLDVQVLVKDVEAQATRSAAARVVMMKAGRSALVPPRTTGMPPVQAPAPQTGAELLHHLLFHTETIVGVRGSRMCELRMIAQNAGAEGSIVLAKVRESKDRNFGYNAQTDVYENLVTRRFPCPRNLPIPGRSDKSSK